MKENFAYCLKTTLVYEGGYSNNPKDPGGATMKGVTQATYNAHRKSVGLPIQDVRKMSQAELESIYRMKFWNLVHGDELVSGVDLVVWDYGVNSGPSKAWSTLLACAGGDAVSTVKKVCASRLAFMRRLKTWGTFGKGWTARVNSVEAKGIALAAGSNAKVVLMAESTESKTKAAILVNVGSGAAAASVSPAIVGATTATLGMTGWIILGVLTIVVLGAAGFILWRMAKAHTDRAAAMEAEAHGHS